MSLSRLDLCPAFDRFFKGSGHGRWVNRAVERWASLVQRDSAFGDDIGRL